MLSYRTYLYSKIICCLKFKFNYTSYILSEYSTSVRLLWPHGTIAMGVWCWLMNRGWGTWEPWIFEVRGGGGVKPRQPFLLWEPGEEWPLVAMQHPAAAGSPAPALSTELQEGHLFLVLTSLESWHPPRDCGEGSPDQSHPRVFQAIQQDRRFILTLGQLLCCPQVADLQKADPSGQFSSIAQSDSLQPHGLQHAKLPCPSPTPRACSNSRPSNRWCHLTISSSVVPFSSCLQYFPASESFPVSHFFTSGGQSIGVSASVSVLPMNI